MVELGWTLGDVVAAREQPAMREAVHFGLLTKRFGPKVGDGRPVLPRYDLTQEQIRALERRRVTAEQEYYDHLARLIAVPEDEPDGG